MKTFYRVDASRVTFREYLYDNSWLVAPIVAVIKLLHLRTPFSTDDPSVENLAAFEVEEADVPAEVRERFAPLTDELEALGFGQPIFHQIYTAEQHTYIYWATFAHPTGRAAARIHHRVWARPGTHKSYLFPVFLSELADGSFVVSSAGKRDMAMPKSIEARYQPGASAAELWQTHERRIDERLPCQPAYAQTRAQLRQMIERHHGALVEFHVNRGVFRPISQEAQEQLVKQSDTTLAATAGATVEDEVLARLQRIQTKNSGWVNFILILGISLLMFLAAGLRDVNRSFLWWMVPILLFHELGHYLAMRWFGYRNLRMFFIPFFGAAVAGKHYNIPGWKKAVVALAGPVPGIAVGAALGIAGIVVHQPKVAEVATLMMILNGLNLLPFLPLDGGWVVHAIVFCRHPLLDLAFRLAAILAFLGMAYVLGGVFFILAVGLLVSLPAAWHVARVAQRLRRQPALAVSPDGVSIPTESVRTILAELGAGRHTRASANVLAQQVTNVFETLNARPPGILASGGLLAVHGGAFLAALVLAVVFTMFRHGSLWANRPPPEALLPYHYRAGSMQHWEDKTAPPILAPGSNVLVASYRRGDATEEFAALTSMVPPAQKLCLFGQSVVVTLPNDDDATREKWLERLRQKTSAVVVGAKDSFLVFQLSCVLPSEQAADLLAQDLNGINAFPYPEKLLPPWSTAWLALPDKDQRRFQKARRTLAKLAALKLRALQEPEVQAITRNELTQTRNTAKHQEALERLDQAAQAAEERLFTQLVAEDKEIDQAVVELHERLGMTMRSVRLTRQEPDRSVRKQKVQLLEQERKALHRQLADQLGPLPLEGDQPKPGSDLESLLATAPVKPRGQSVSIRNVQFRSLGTGLPAFVQWLTKRGVSELRYGFEADNEDEK